jgi:hypothetical protein
MNQLIQRRLRMFSTNDRDKMNFSSRRPSFSIQCWILGVGIVAIVFWYMTRWLEMPLYPDEVALRLQKARYLADGPISYGLFPCRSNVREISLLFRPIAYVFSAFDFGFGWSLVRGIPLVGVMFTVTTVLFITLRKNAVGASLFLTAGLVGVVGSGLILMRGEAPILFLGTACLVGYSMAKHCASRPILATSYLTVTSCLALFAFFIHPESLVLLPVFFLVCMKTALHQKTRFVKTIAALSIVCAVGGAWSTLNALKLDCPEFPAAEFAAEIQGLPGLARIEGVPAVKDYFTSKLERYADQFTLKAGYESDYLPAVHPGSDRELLSSMNTALRLAALLNLILACCALVYSGFRTMIMLGKRYSAFSCKIASALDDPSPFLFLATAGYWALFIYDTQTAFYRDFHIHFMLVMLNALALSTLGDVAKLFVWPLGILSVVLSISSTLMLQTYMSEKFAAGWVGPSISQHTNWSMVRLETMQAEKDCKIGNQDSEIIIDDMTYDAMKNHRHLTPITYLGFARDPKTSSANWLQEVFQQTKPSAIVARCASFENFGLKYSFMEGQICCLKFGP